MTRGVAQKDVDFGSITPFVMRMLSLQFGIQHIHRAAKGMEMIKVYFYFRSGKQGGGRSIEQVWLLPFSNPFSFSEFGWNGISYVGIVLEGSGPEMCINRLRPAVGCVKQGGPGMSCEVFDAILRFSILMMGIGSTEG